MSQGNEHRAAAVAAEQEGIGVDERSVIVTGAASPRGIGRATAMLRRSWPPSWPSATA
jgi:microcompartment protein CcmK/EutM